MFDLAFFLVALILNSILNPYSFEILGFFSNWSLTLSVVIIVITITMIPLIFFLIEKIIRNDTFNIKHPTPKWFDPSNSSFWVEKHILWKIIIPGVSIISPLIYYFLNIQTKKYFPANTWIILLDSVFFTIFIAISIMGILFFRQYSLNGKILFLFLIATLSLLFGFGILGIIYTVIVRTFKLIVPFLFIGIGLYIFYHKDRWLKNNNHRKIFFGFLLINMLVGITYQITFTDFVTQAEINFVQTSSEFAENNDSTNSTILMFGSFHFDYPYEYYANRSNLQYIPSYSEYIHPANHTNLDENGTSYNALQSLCSSTQYDNIIILLDKSYLDQGVNLLDGRNYGKMTLDEFDQYNNLYYLNRIAVGSNMKSLYWVIPI